MRRRRWRRDLQTHPSGPPPRPTPQPCPGEGAAAFRPFSPSNESPQRRPFAGDRHLFPRQQELAALANELQ